LGLALVSPTVITAYADVPALLAIAVPALLTGIVLIVLSLTVWNFRRKGTSATLARWRHKADKSGGVASWWDHWRTSSKYAMAKRAGFVRPSTLANISLWTLYFRIPVTDYASRLATVGWHTVHASHEEITVRFGGPRVGKTGELACRVVDAPGAGVVTSTKFDIVELTIRARSEKGPVYIFNPSGIGDLASTFKWSPLSGCRNPAVAIRRAADLIAPSASAEAEKWNAQARSALAILLHAAALGNRNMRTIHAWIANPRPDGPSHKAVRDALAASRERETWIRSCDVFFRMNDKTQTSIIASIQPALEWLSDSRVAAIADTASDEVLDMVGLIEQCGTVYLLGAESGITAPLIAAMTSELAEQARMLSGRSKGGRLDPPLTLALDEAALICPVPLDRWTADMGGRGITIHISIQSRKQMEQRWGREGAGVILNNCAVILVYGGTRDPDDLETWSKLSGDREEETPNRDENGRVTGYGTRRVPVLSTGTIANLPERHVMIVRRGMPVSVGRTHMAWDRRDIKRHLRVPYQGIKETDYAEQLHDENSKEASAA
jgi:hypothetical protein